MGGTALTVELSDVGGPPYLLDTHVWLWHVAGSLRLPPSLRTAIDESAGRIWYSPISAWEIGLLHIRGRVRLEGGPRAWMETALARFPLTEAALTREVALRSTELDLRHGDPADRLLAATALVHGLTLLTVDERLLAAGWLPTRSS